MKQIMVFILAAALAANIVGCSSDSTTTKTTNSSSNVNLENENSNGIDDSTVANTATTDYSSVPAVKLFRDWPKKVPILSGKITASDRSTILNDRLRPTGKYRYKTTIYTTNIKSNKEVYDFYRSRFAKITDTGSVDDKGGYCAGIIGAWEVKVSSSLLDKQKNIYSVAVEAQPNK